jgi:hypothetical protein
LLPYLALSGVLDSALGLAIAAALTVSIVATLTLLAGLALRVPDRNLAQRTLRFVRTWRWLIPTAAVALFAWQVVAAFATSSTPWFTSVFPWTGCAVYILALVVFVCGIRTLKLLGDYRRVFPGCLAVARAGTLRSQGAHAAALAIKPARNRESSGDRPDWRRSNAPTRD